MCDLRSRNLPDQGYILAMHHLSPGDEQKMMTRIAGIIYPGRHIVVRLRKVETAQKEKSPSYSPPISRLVDEHKQIKRMLALIPAMLDGLDLATEEGRQLVLSAVDFIRNFADRYHHAKEEDILFKLFDENLDILKVMCVEHEAGRAHVAAIVEAANRRDTAAAAEHLTAYGVLLIEHIKEEDEILYPWLDRQLSDTQVGRLFSAFGEVDGRFLDARRKYDVFVQIIENRFGRMAPKHAK